MPFPTILIICILCAVFSIQSEAIVQPSNCTWSSSRLTNPDASLFDSEKPIALASDTNDNLYVGFQFSSQNVGVTIPALYKTTPSGRFLWAVYSNLTDATLFDIAIDHKANAAYLLVTVVVHPQSSEFRRGSFTQARVLKFTNVISATDSVAAEELVSESTFFSSNVTSGITKLFAAVLNQQNGDLYLAGATSQSIYSASRGKGDIIVIRLSATGEVLAASQIGTHFEDVGRAIELSADETVVTIAAETIPSIVNSYSSIYRLAANDLRIVDGPHIPTDQGSTSFLEPRSIAIANPSQIDGPSMVTFVAGTARVREHQQDDAFIHIYSNLPWKTQNVLLKFDSVGDKAGVDSCVSMRVGVDGNAYCFGYSEYENPSTRALQFLVVSPTGQLEYREEHYPVSSDISPAEVPTGMLLSQSLDNITMTYIGYSTSEVVTKAQIGFVRVNPGTIKPFEGFGQQSVSDDDPGKKEVPESESSFPIAVVAGGAAGGVVLVVFIALMLHLLLRRRATETLLEEQGSA